MEKKSIYHDCADMYRKNAENDSYSKKMVIMYEALAQIDSINAVNDVLDTGIYNDNIKGYLKIAVEKAGLDTETKNKLLSALTSAFDEYTAKEALDYNKNR